VDKKRFVKRVVPGVVAVIVAAGGSLLVSGVASATPPTGSLGSLTFDPPTGTNATVGKAITSGPCNNGGDSAFLDVVGPADSPFPPGNPYNITTTESTDYSQTDPFTVPFGVSLQTAANDRGKPLTPGEYDFTLHCVDSFTSHDFGTFTGAEFFTDATTYNTGSALSLSPAPSSAPSPSPSASPTPAQSSSPTTSATTDTTPSATVTSDGGGVGAPSDSGTGSPPNASTGILPQTGAPVAGMFLGGLALLAVGLGMVVRLKRPRTAAFTDPGAAADEPDTGQRS